MNTPVQQPLCFAKPAAPAIPGVTEENVKFAIAQMKGCDWQTARELCAKLGWPATDSNLRWFRSVAHASKGQIAGGQRGYKLIDDMTREEYHRFRNWMNSQCDEMKRRLIESDRVWYARHPVEMI
jgi:hypothetical protein